MSQLDGNPAQEEQTTEQQATPVEQSVSNDDQGNDVEAVLKEIVAPDGRQKYGSVADAIKALKHSQEYISTLEQKIKEMERALEEERSLNKVIEEAVKEPEKAESQEAPKQDNLEEMLERLLSQKEQEKTRQQNLSAFQQSLSGVAENVDEFVEAKASELGLGKDFLLDLAARSPEAAKKLLVGDSSASTGMGGTVNAAAVAKQSQPETLKPVIFGSTSEMIEQLRAAKQRYGG